MPSKTSGFSGWGFKYEFIFTQIDILYRALHTLNDHLISMRNYAANKFIFAGVVWHVAASCWNHIFSKFYSSTAGKKKRLLYFESFHCRFPRSGVQSHLQTKKPSDFFFNAISSLQLLEDSPSPKYDNIFYWQNQRMKNMLYCCIKIALYRLLFKNKFHVSTTLQLVNWLQLVCEFYWVSFFYECKCRSKYKIHHNVLLESPSFWEWRGIDTFTYRGDIFSETRKTMKHSDTTSWWAFWRCCRCWYLNLNVVVCWAYRYFIRLSRLVWFES